MELVSADGGAADGDLGLVLGALSRWHRWGSGPGNGRRVLSGFGSMLPAAKDVSDTVDAIHLTDILTGE
jgi:hypothetical protein